MQEPIEIHTLNLWPDRDTIQSWRYLEAGQPVDFTQQLGGVGYAGEITILRCDKVIWQAPLVLDSEGYVTSTIPQATGLELRTPRRIDAEGQIIIATPIPEQKLTWLFPVAVYEVHA